MDNRWQEGQAHGLDQLDLLVYRSNLIGSDETLVQYGGGNTSTKLKEVDFRARPVDVLRVKGSGTDLRTITRAGFSGLVLEDVLPLMDREAVSDEEMIEYLTCCLLSPRDPRPSIETLLHASLPFQEIDHTHADAILAITDLPDSEKIVREVYGRDGLFVPYVKPGFTLAKMVRDRFEGQKFIVLDKHGSVTFGDSSKACYLNTVTMISLAEEYVQARRRVQVPVHVPLPDRRGPALRILPLLRGRLGERVVLHVDDAPEVLEFVNGPFAEATQRGTGTPDQLLRVKRCPLVITQDAGGLDEAALSRVLDEAIQRYVAEYDAYFQRHQSGQPRLAPYPRIILVPGLGMIAAGPDKKAAAIAADTYRHVMGVIRDTEGMARFTPVTEAEAFEIEYWPLELYKLTLAPREKELARRVALITGAADGIGRAIAERFAQEGAHVALADINRDGAQEVAARIDKQHGAGRALAVPVDVTREAEIVGAVEEVVLRYGGLDILVCNAGYVNTAPLTELAAEEWDRHFAINTRAYALATREAARVMKRQGRGGAILYNVSKAALAPGKEAAAYGASKAATAHLARIAAEELGPSGIRVNYVTADNVPTRLMQRMLEQRAAAQGVPVEELRRQYAERNALRLTNVPLEDVAEAFLYLASDRARSTTGAPLPVDGGLRDAYPR